jgi:ribosomal protein S26
MPEPTPTPADVQPLSESELAEIEARHRHGTQKWTDGSVEHLCAWCSDEWPCDKARLVATVRQAQQAASAARAERDSWLDEYRRQRVRTDEVKHERNVALADLVAALAGLAPLRQQVAALEAAQPNALCYTCGLRVHHPLMPADAARAGETPPVPDRS